MHGKDKHKEKKREKEEHNKKEHDKIRENSKSYPIDSLEVKPSAPPAPPVDAKVIQPDETLKKRKNHEMNGFLQNELLALLFLHLYALCSLVEHHFTLFMVLYIIRLLMLYRPS
jgi:hypothetical protein